MIRAFTSRLTNDAKRQVIQLNSARFRFIDDQVPNNIPYVTGS